MSDISLEPLANRGNSDGEGVKVTSISEIGAMSNRDAVSVSDSAAQITIGGNKTSIEIQNTGSKIIYYGGSGVTSTTGIKLFPNQIRIFNKVKSTFNFYHICASGESSTLRVVEYAL